MGSSKNFPVSLPQRVSPVALSSILEYCRFHQAAGRSNKERKIFDEKFVRMDAKKLCELTSAADSLHLKPLVDLTSRALARVIEGKTPDEIRDTFKLPDDLTEEEKLEPLRNVTGDPRIRLLNRLYERKRNELKERHKNNHRNITIEDHSDGRSVDDLLSYINGSVGVSRRSGTNKNKNNRRRKDQFNATSSTSNTNDKDLKLTCSDDGNSEVCHHSPCGSHTRKKSIDKDYPRLELHDDIDDDLDPAVKEELDREVEDFARRLNSNWPDSMQAILSPCHDDLAVDVGHR